ncbi:diacylglycerol kinase family protein [uncultured Desulfobacter sp.]|uniref:diacylglycerol kinase family protein n=1 Tax=uncultured Desulfobacter sp. TaxID=240139 RepID=UPI0029C7E185|nr:diacylglycerol kinase family protein [uncultured Desulfobacter sp.]
MSFSIKKRLQSFVYAVRGIVTLVKTQHNAWIHLFATLGVISFGFHFGVSGAEWSLLIVAIIVVWFAEALNTAVEFLADTITKEHHPLIGNAKDVAAGGVLVASIGAAAIGIIVFWPYVSRILGAKS